VVAGRRLPVGFGRIRPPFFFQKQQEQFHWDQVSSASLGTDEKQEKLSEITTDETVRYMVKTVFVVSYVPQRKRREKEKATDCAFSNNS
jgi:hypothetical protein